MNNTANQILEALIALLNATQGEGNLEQAQHAARGAISLARKDDPVDDGALEIHRADSDTAKIVRGKQLLALVVRSSSGRWVLCGTDRKPLSKVEYSTPKKAFAQFEA